MKQVEIRLNASNPNHTRSWGGGEHSPRPCWACPGLEPWKGWTQRASWTAPTSPTKPQLNSPLEMIILLSPAKIMLPGFSCMDLIIKSNHEETMGYITQHCCKVVRSMQICSPTTFSTGTRLTWTRQKFPGPTRYENWPNASIKCIDSISPHQECHCHYARWEKILSL